MEWSLFPMISGGLGRLSGGDENQDCGVGTGDAAVHHLASLDINGHQKQYCL